MNTIHIILYIYLFIGLFVSYYDWNKYQKPIYNQAKKMGMVEDGMIPLYMIGVILFWPIKVFNWLFRN